MRIKIFALFNAILLLLAGVSPVFAQDAGSSSTGSSGGTEITSTVERSTRTTTETLGVDSNTTLLIVIAALAFLILIVALVRGASRRDVTKTVIHDHRK
jgi:hypothetical protein